MHHMLWVGEIYIWKSIGIWTADEQILAHRPEVIVAYQYLVRTSNQLNHPNSTLESTEPVKCLAESAQIHSVPYIPPSQFKHPLTNQPNSTTLAPSTGTQKRCHPSTKSMESSSTLPAPI